MANRFKQAAPRAKKLYRSGRYKTFAAAMKAALSKSKKRHPAKKRVTRRKARKRISALPAARTFTKSKSYSLSGLLTKAKKIVKEKIDVDVVRKYHATGVRHKRKIQKRINELKTRLRKLS